MQLVTAVVGGIGTSVASYMGNNNNNNNNNNSSRPAVTRTTKRKRVMQVNYNSNSDNDGVEEVVEVNEYDEVVEDEVIISK